MTVEHRAAAGPPKAARDPAGGSASAKPQASAGSMSESLRAVKGMNDILPPESARWEWFEDKVRALMRRYGYANVRTPIVEPTALFVRGLGEVTDIVEKEMYSFEDAMNGDRLTLRPEATAGVVRADHRAQRAYNGRQAPVLHRSRCSATSGRRRAAIASSTRSAPKRSAMPGPTSTPS